MNSTIQPPGSASALIRLQVAFLLSFSHTGPGRPPRQHGGSPVEMLSGAVLKLDEIWTMPETFLEWNKGHSFLTQTKCRIIRSTTPWKQKHLAGSVRLRNRCYGNSQFRSVKAPPSRTKRATSDVASEPWSRALPTAVNHVCHVWLGRCIAAASCSRADCGYFCSR